MHGLNILMIFEQLIDGGFETHLYGLCKYLKRLGHEITLYGKAIDDIWREQYAELDINFVSKPEQGQYDVIHAHSLFWAVLRGHELSLRLSRPLVITYHGLFLEGIDEARRGASAIIAVSREVQKLVGSGEIIENGIDLEYFKPVPKEDDDFVVTYLGRLDSSRHDMIETLIEACGIAGVKCEIIGDRLEFVHYPHVTWHGVHMDVRPYVARSSAVFSTGRGIREAMSMGRPVVVLNSMGYDGIITPENVELLRKYNFSGRATGKDFDVQDIADDIMILKNNPETWQYLAKWSREYARENFSLHHMALYTDAIYRKVLGKAE